MSHTPTFSQTTEPPTVTSARVLPPAGSSLSLDETTQRLRAELAATTDSGRQARLLMELANLEERSGDESAAARDYLAAYNADSSFREPLEGLAALLERRRSFKNLAKLVDALLAAAAAPDERVRALLMRSAYRADVVNDLAQATADAREATLVDDAPPAERASAWLTFELLAARTGDAEGRETALGERAKYAMQHSWRALLLVDQARLAAASTRVDAAVSLLEEARSLKSSATWTATTLLEQILREHLPAHAGDQAPAHAETYAEVLDETATLIEQATLDEVRGDALGVPRWTRTPARLVDAWLRAAEARLVLSQIDRAAATLDRALSYVTTMQGDEGPLAEGLLINARIRIAERTGDTALAAELAQRRLSSESDGGLAAALAMRIAEHAASQRDLPAAFEALSRAIRTDPGCLPARALQLDMLADGNDPSAFAAQLESFADHLSTDEARGRAFLLASYVWAVQAKDTAGAKAALSQAGMYGMAPSTNARVARALASISDDLGWYEEATKRLLSAGGDDDEALSLCVELVRLRRARGDAEGEAKALRDMAIAPKGGWLARVLEAFLPSSAPAGPVGGATTAAATERAHAAVAELAALERDPELARGLGLVAAMRAHTAGDLATARRQLRELADRDPSDAIVIAMCADLDREAGDHAAAARVASAGAAATSDPELASALRFEAAFEQWRDGDRRGALESIEAAIAGAPEAARMVLGWAARGVDVDSIEARRKGIDRATEGNVADPRVLGLERFATEVAAGNADAATAALEAIDCTWEGDIDLAAALARLAWPHGVVDSVTVRTAIDRIAARGPKALTLASAEETRMAREGGDNQEVMVAAQRWFEAGGGLPAALEWLAAAMALGEPHEEIQARLALAATLSGDAREAMMASAALVAARAEPGVPTPLVDGRSPAVRLANLELAPPGCDPRRRVAVLAELDGALGGNAQTDAISISGWSALATEDVDGAVATFERATIERPDDIGGWEGLRSCAELRGDKALRARAAAELGARCRDADRGAAFWEEAALLWLELDDDANAERALEESFARDAKRAVAFDKLFRRVRTRKDNDKLLTLIARRLVATQDAQEIQKLFWEQARVLREKGEQDAALESLKHVTMLDPDHVGALALLGEINIRRGNFEDAAISLARLAKLENAPPKNRMTAGIAAVDLYENKLDRHDKALEVLLSLHQAKLSSLPVRERLARAAARTGAWHEATSMLEELMRERSDAQGRIEAARLAMSIYRDRLANPQGAATAIVKLLEEAPADGEALDMLLEIEYPWNVRDPLLENARRTLVDSLQKRPTDVPSVRRLANVARALSEDALHQTALGVLVSLGAADTRSEHTFIQLATKKSRPPQIAIGKTMMRALLAPGDEGPIADLFGLLGPTLVEALGPTLQTCGVGKRDKVDPRSGLTLRNEIAAWAGAFGVHEFDLYVGGADPLGVQGVPGEPPSLVVGPGINAPIAPMTRARVARELVAIVRGTTVARLRDDITVAAIVVAACRLAAVPIEHPPYAVLAEVERLLGKAIGRKTRKLLPDICGAVATRGGDPRVWSRRALASHDRVGAIASGDPSVVLMDILGASQDHLAKAVIGNSRAEELLRFVLSPQYLELRVSLGLDGGERP